MQSFIFSIHWMCWMLVPRHNQRRKNTFGFCRPSAPVDVVTPNQTFLHVSRTLTIPSCLCWLSHVLSFITPGASVCPARRVPVVMCLACGAKEGGWKVVGIGESFIDSNPPALCQETAFITPPLLNYSALALKISSAPTYREQSPPQQRGVENVC